MLNSNANTDIVIHNPDRTITSLLHLSQCTCFFFPLLLSFNCHPFPLRCPSPSLSLSQPSLPFLSFVVHRCHRPLSLCSFSDRRSSDRAVALLEPKLSHPPIHSTQIHTSTAPRVVLVLVLVLSLPYGRCIIHTNPQPSHHTHHHGHRHTTTQAFPSPSSSSSSSSHSLAVSVPIPRSCVGPPSPQSTSSVIIHDHFFPLTFRSSSPCLPDLSLAATLSHSLGIDHHCTHNHKYHRRKNDDDHDDIHRNVGVVVIVRFATCYSTASTHACDTPYGTASVSVRA